VIKLSTRHYVSLKCDYRWFGNDYGGFYVCTEIVNLNSNDEIIVYSAGVGEDVSFDMDVVKEFGKCKIFAFDPTPKSIEWVKRQDLPVNYRFFPNGISTKTGEQKMYLPKNKDFVSGSIYESRHLSTDNYIIVQMKSIDDILKENGHKYIDIIKMDIEGSEFSVIEHLKFHEVNCGQFLVEFHGRFFRNGSKLIKKAINILKNNGYYCFAISNTGEEYSFINKDLYKGIIEKKRHYLNDETK
jgi:FkbM family methyltransferase